MSNIEILHGDCLAILRTIPDSSVDSIVTDPPYGLNFMGYKWDYDVPCVEVWAECLRVLKPGGHLLAFAGTRTQHRMAVRIEDAGFEIRDMIAWVYGSGMPKAKSCLKPAIEPITMARKPASKALALNIDGCRVGDEDGRWPANLIHDGSDVVISQFPDAPGQLAKARNDGVESSNAVYGKLRNITHRPDPRGDTGSAARFFYCAKASKKDRGEGNDHPTVKPTDLMAYLCRLVTPPGGVVLDPFMGSGSTGKAAATEGFSFIGIEREASYVAIARSRICPGAAMAAAQEGGNVAKGAAPVATQGEQLDAKDGESAHQTQDQSND